MFKQNVTPEDFFLGVDPLRHQGLSCSDALVLKIHLPETKLADIDLDVRRPAACVARPASGLRHIRATPRHVVYDLRCMPLQKVRPTFVRLMAPKFKVKIHLGEKVDDQKGNAKWESEKSMLVVTLPIVHDWDSKMQTSAADELD